MQQQVLARPPPPHILRIFFLLFHVLESLRQRMMLMEGGCTAASRLINIKMSPLTRSIKSSSYIHCRVMKSSCSLSYWPSSYKVAAAAAVKYIFHGLLNAIVASLLILQSRSTNEMKNLFKYIHSSSSECVCSYSVKVRIQIFFLVILMITVTQQTSLLLAFHCHTHAFTSHVMKPSLSFFWRSHICM